MNPDELMAITDRVFQKIADRLGEQNIRLPEHFKEHIRQVFQTGAVNARDIEHQMASAVDQWLETHSVSAGAEPATSPSQTNNVVHPQSGDIVYSIMPQIRAMEGALVVVDLVVRICSSARQILSSMLDQ